MSNQFYKLKISQINYPIESATTLTFQIPDHLKELFIFKPGQHLILKFNINGKEVRRSYSLNSTPYIINEIQITVKRIKKGLVSNYIGDQLEVGQEIDVMLPQGRFHADIHKEDYKTYFLFAAGSGITPIFSILKSVLTESINSSVYLFYGNKNQDSILFYDELNNLESKFSNRLKIIHTLSQPKVWSTWKQWKGKQGRIDKNAVEWFITNHPPIAQNTEYYICGPQAMNIDIRNALLQLQIPKENIHLEQFGGKVNNSELKIKAFPNALLHVKIEGKNHSILIPEGKTILQTLKENNLNPPYSCESGVCATCVAKLKKGNAQMTSCMALNDDEVNKGLILTCQALPMTKEIEIEFNT